MFVYWGIFLLFALGAILNMRPYTNRNRNFFEDPKYIVWFFLLVTIIGFRHEVGGDWLMYLKLQNIYTGRTLSETSFFSDPFFHLLVWGGANIWGGVYIVNLICASIFAWGLLSFCKYQPRPDLALLLAVPYLIIVVSMGYVRQGVGIGLGLIAIIALLDRKFLRFIFFLILASCFHKTAFLYFSFAIFFNFRNRLLMVLGLGIFTLLFALLFAIEYVATQLDQNAFVGMDSKGTLIRLALIWMPATLLLLFRKRFGFERDEQNFWFWVAISSYLFIILLIISPHNTIVDRLALYWIPLQIVILTRIPDAFGITGERNATWVYFLVILEALILFVWLSFSPQRAAWLPYKFYPFVWAFN